MTYLEICGGRPLGGTLKVQGAKNSALPILAATLLHSGKSVIQNCPHLRDVDVAVSILEHLGCGIQWEGNALAVDTGELSRWDIPKELAGKMRSSICFLGALMARMGRAEIGDPGGCCLGPRPVDIHIEALKMLGAGFSMEKGVLAGETTGLHGVELRLRFPSVGATENCMLAACGAEGETRIQNAAREPEIEDLQGYLNAIGYAVSGAGTDTVSVGGRRKTRDAVYTVMPDRMAAATWLSVAAGTGGSVHLTSAEPRHIEPILQALRKAGALVTAGENDIELRCTGPLRGVGVLSTAPYPGFPTDAQPLLTAALLRAKGSTVVIENIFKNRYQYVQGLTDMGADILTEGRLALIRGVSALRGAKVRATDLRGGAALMIAALQGEGTTELYDTEHIYRGYEDPVGTLEALGADIHKVDRR